MAIKIFISMIILGSITLSVFFYFFLFTFDPFPAVQVEIPLEDIDLETFQGLSE